MTSDETVSRSKELAARVLAPQATVNDKEGRFSREAVAALGEHGLLGIFVPVASGGSALGPAALADVTTELSAADPSVAMVFLMHCLGVAAIAAAPSSAPLRRVLEEIATGGHLTTLAFSEAGSRSHFWAPVSRARRSGWHAGPGDRRRHHRLQHLDRQQSPEHGIAVELQVKLGRLRHGGERG